jgi:peptidoglycan/LPS O-acetylase OafA/YrhL
MAQRYEALDGLRGLAAMSVVLIHVPWPNHITGTHAAQHVYLFVDLFFVLSGFILTVVYREAIASRAEFRRFLILRFFRIYPLHVAVLGALLGMELFKLLVSSGGMVVASTAPFGGPKSPGSLLGHLFLLQGSGLVEPSWNAPSWSIGCEAIAYILFGIAALAGVARWQSFLPAALAVSAGSYALLLGVKGDLGATFDFGLLRCIGGFSLGVAVAVCVNNRAVAPTLCNLPDAMISAITLGLAGTAAALLCVVDGYRELLLVPVFALLVLFLQSDRGIFASMLRSRLFAFCGLVSYSIYMVNYPIFMAIDSVLKRTVVLGQWSGDLMLAATFLIVILIAWASFLWIEAPGRALGRRLAERTETDGRNGLLLRGARSTTP